MTKETFNSTHTHGGGGKEEGGRERKREQAMANMI